MDWIKTTKGGNKTPMKLKPCPRCGGELKVSFMFVDGHDPKTGKRWGKSGHFPYCTKCYMNYLDPEEVSEPAEWYGSIGDLSLQEE